MTIIKDWPLSQYVWHVKETSLRNGHEYRVWVKMCSPSLVMVPTPYEWKNSRVGKETPSKETNIRTSWLVLLFFDLVGRNIFSLILSSSENCLSAPSSSVFLSLVSYQLNKFKSTMQDMKLPSSKTLFFHAVNKRTNKTFFRLYTLFCINTSVLILSFFMYHY